MPTGPHWPGYIHRKGTPPDQREGPEQGSLFMIGGSLTGGDEEDEDECAPFEVAECAPDARTVMVTNESGEQTFITCPEERSFMVTLESGQQALIEPVDAYDFLAEGVGASEDPLAHKYRAIDWAKETVYVTDEGEQSSEPTDNSAFVEVERILEATYECQDTGMRVRFDYRPFYEE